MIVNPQSRLKILILGAVSSWNTKAVTYQIVRQLYVIFRFTEHTGGEETELIDPLLRQRFRTRAEVRQKVVWYMEGFYNSQCIHLALFCCISEAYAVWTRGRN